jgi:hypothetical protein
MPSEPRGRRPPDGHVSSSASLHRADAPAPRRCGWPRGGAPRSAPRASVRSPRCGRGVPRERAAVDQAGVTVDTRQVDGPSPRDPGELVGRRQRVGRCRGVEPCPQTTRPVCCPAYDRHGLQELAHPETRPDRSRPCRARPMGVRCTCASTKAGPITHPREVEAILVRRRLLRRRHPTQTTRLPRTSSATASVRACRASRSGRRRASRRPLPCLDDVPNLPCERSVTQDPRPVRRDR